MSARGNLTLAETFYGRAINARRRGAWRHPWTITPAWLGGTQRWVATVWPGFVNGEAPSVRTTQKEQAATGRDFGVNPLTGERYFSAPIFSAQTATAARSETLDIPITLDPAIGLNFRAVGYDGEGEVPQFFVDRGAARTPRRESDDEGSVSGDVAARPAGLRLLRACDVILHQPRLALSSQVTLEPGLVTGISNVTQTLTLRSAAAGDALRVIAGSFNPPDAAPDPVRFDYDEEAWDELLIGTVYLLSPPGLPLGSEPDGTWTPYVRHQLFWNLHYEPARFRPVTTDAGTPFIPPLAAGAGQLVINFLVASINDATQQALNVIQGHSMAGTFFTPTGSGHDAAFPTDAAPVPAAGLNKDARLAAHALAAARARRASTLEPAFPFTAVPFDPALLAA